jgi:mRNA-degrading endonuclease RelE of RelBE toxin-antitoxin system
MARRIGQAVTLLAETGQGDVKRLRGHEREYRLRVGQWRVRFERDPASRTITVLHVLSRAGLPAMRIRRQG